MEERHTAKQVMRTAILLVLAIATAVDMVRGERLVVDEGGEMWRKGRREGGEAEILFLSMRRTNPLVTF